MADVLNTSTLEMRASVDEVQYEDPWLAITRAQYDLWSVIPLRYRTWALDHIEEMTQPEKDAVDLALMEATRDGIVQQLDSVENILRAFAGLLVDELNAHGTRINGILNAIDDGASLASIKAAVAVIQDVPTRNLALLRQSIRNKIGT